MGEIIDISKYKKTVPNPTGIDYTKLKSAVNAFVESCHATDEKIKEEKMEQFLYICGIMNDEELNEMLYLVQESEKRKTETSTTS